MHFFSNFHLFVSMGKTMSSDKRILKVCMLVFEEEDYKKAREFKVTGKDLLWGQGQRRNIEKPRRVV